MRDTSFVQEKPLQVLQLGLVDYLEADALQRAIQTQRAGEQVPDSLLLLEHPNVITLGTRGTKEEILAHETILSKKQVQIVSTDRGGQNTVHAPGQLVGYLILHLYRKKKALRQFIHDLEHILISTLQQFDIKAFHHDDHVGVWTTQGKIGAIGISVNHGVTRHGFALNVNTNLEVFDWIVPCGIPQGEVTSMQHILKRDVAMQEVEKVFIDAFMTKKEYNKVIYKSLPGW